MFGLCLLYTVAVWFYAEWRIEKFGRVTFIDGPTFERGEVHDLGDYVSVVLTFRALFLCVIWPLFVIALILDPRGFRPIQR